MVHHNGYVEATRSGSLPSVDVVIPVYNRRHTIRRAVDSVLRQTHPRVTLTVVDDGSTDGTPEIIAEYGDKVRLVRQDRRGPAAARNRGAAAGDAEFVAFLDSDDEAEERWAERLVELAAVAPISCCGARIERPDKSTRVRQPGNLDRHWQPIFLPGLFMVRRDLFEWVEGFDERLRFGENSELGWRLMSALEQGSIGRPAGTDKPLITIHQQAMGRSQASNPVALRDSAEIILGKHHDRLAKNSHHLAAYYAISGVNSLRLGDVEMARSRLRSAIRNRPLDYRYWARLFQAHLPAPLRDRARPR